MPGGSSQSNSQSNPIKASGPESKGCRRRRPKNTDTNHTTIRSIKDSTTGNRDNTMGNRGSSSSRRSTNNTNNNNNSKPGDPNLSTSCRPKLLGWNGQGARTRSCDLTYMYAFSPRRNPFCLARCLANQDQTNLPRYRTTQYRDVRRLHSEFIKLAEHLISANPEAIVPAVPPALTSAGAGTEEDEARVKALMQRWLNYVCSSDVLIRDEETQLFVESDFGYSPVVKKKQPATGVRRKILKQFAPPPDDTPELQEARPIVKLFYLGAMDAGHKVDRLVKTRRGQSASPPTPVVQQLTPSQAWVSPRPTLAPSSAP